MAKGKLQYFETWALDLLVLVARVRLLQEDDDGNMIQSWGEELTLRNNQQ